MDNLEHLEVDDIVSGFPERMVKIALFDPLFELQRKKQTDKEGQSIDMMELGLLTLLFFFEQKLMRSSKTGVKDLAYYLHRVIEGKLRVDLSDCEELARSIIQVFRPASGRKREFTFFNWEAREPLTVYTSILKANAFDSKTNTQYYALDEDGLELVFATKEFYAEFQLSIHQLVLRKQLEKGEFQGALRQINEMLVDVESLEERMSKLEHEIRRSIVSEETLQKYSTLLGDIYARLQRENEEFQELRQFAKETRMRLHADSMPDKQLRAYEYILKISNELEKVHSNHSDLLKKCMNLKNEALYSAKESLYYTGISSFNFDQDLVNYIIGTPLPLEALNGVMAPFMRLAQAQSWSPLTIFAEQSISGAGEQEPREDAFLEASDANEDNEYMKKRNVLFKEMMRVLLQELDQHARLELEQFINKLEETSKVDWIASRSFYDFWLILHQRSPIRASLTDVTGDESGLQEVFSLLGKRTLFIEEARGMITHDARFHIQNMIFILEEDQDGI